MDSNTSTKKVGKCVRVLVNFSYMTNIIPKHCRNPRPVRFDDGQAFCDIPIISKKDAPVAIVAREKLSYAPVTKTYRWYGGKLYRCNFRGYARGESRSNLGKIGVDGRITWKDPYGGPESYTKKIESIRDYYSKLIMIGNQVYREVSEPRYVIMTFGLGCNHGGTALMDSTYYNSNIPWHRYYNLLDKKEAKKQKDIIARRRGDTESVGTKPHTMFRVLIPEAIQVNPEEYGGPGDDFMNKVNAITESSCNAVLSGMRVITAALR